MLGRVAQGKTLLSSIVAILLSACLIACVVVSELHFLETTSHNMNLTKIGVHSTGYILSYNSYPYRLELFDPNGVQLTIDNVSDVVDIAANPGSSEISFYVLRANPILGTSLETAYIEKRTFDPISSTWSIVTDNSFPSPSSYIDLQSFRGIAKTQKALYLCVIENSLTFPYAQSYLYRKANSSSNWTKTQINLDPLYTKCTDLAADKSLDDDSVYVLTSEKRIGKYEYGNLTNTWDFSNESNVTISAIAGIGSFIYVGQHIAGGFNKIKIFDEVGNMMYERPVMYIMDLDAYLTSSTTATLWHLGDHVIINGKERKNYMIHKYVLKSSS